MKKLLFVLLIILSVNSCSRFRRGIAKASPVVRVLLAQGKRFFIKTPGPYLIHYGSQKASVMNRLYVKYSTNGLLINGVPVSAKKAEVDPGGFFSYHDTNYRGMLQIVESGDSLFLINVIDMESYLYGVVSSEMPPSWDYEALKAQAVVARTYALFQMVRARQKKQLFDLYADTRSQVYRGIAAEDKYGIAAVDATAGQVIRYHGKIIQAFFHSCSGGMTEASEYVFGEAHPYLVSVSSPFASINKNDKWRISVSLKFFKDKLNMRSVPVAVNVLTRSPSKRILSLKLIGKDGEEREMTGIELRRLIGNAVMKSTRANLFVNTKEKRLFITGVGYGHGVGMGQWDALGMARAGWKYPAIIAYFYRGTTIDKLW